jgi:hypothetical protein
MYMYVCILCWKLISKLYGCFVCYIPGYRDHYASNIIAVPMQCCNYYSMCHKKGFMTVLSNVRLVVTVSLVVIRAPNGPYGTDGWLGLFGLLGLGWYMYITVLSIGLLGLSGLECQDWWDCQHSKCIQKSC